MYRVTRLDNGLTVATATMPHMVGVSLGLWVGTGGRHEPAPLNGASHFIEHMLFKGTRRRTAQEISSEIEGIGGYLNAFTSEENTCYYARAHAEHFHQLLDVLMDMILHARFCPGDIRKERAVIKEELALYLDQPQHHVQEILNELLWPNHPLGRSITGTFRTLDRMRRSQLLGFRNAHYRAGNLLVTAAGRLSHDKLVNAVKPYARSLPKGGRPTFPPVPPPQRKPLTRVIQKRTAQAQMALGFLVCSRHDEKRFALRILNAVLGENMSSRLFQVLREDHALAYSISSSVNHVEDSGALVISAGIEAAHLPKALRLIAGQLRRLKQVPLTRKEISRARDYLVGQLELGLESTDHQMNWVGENLLAFGRVSGAAFIKNRLNRVTPSMVRQAAAESLQPALARLAVISPDKPSSDYLNHMRF